MHATSPQATPLAKVGHEGVACPLSNSQSLESQSGLYSTIRNRLTTHSKPDVRYTIIHKALARNLLLRLAANSDRSCKKSCRKTCKRNGHNLTRSCKNLDSLLLQGSCMSCSYARCAIVHGRFLQEACRSLARFIAVLLRTISSFPTLFRSDFVNLN